jgi:hypothetical protein
MFFLISLLKSLQILTHDLGSTDHIMNDFPFSRDVCGWIWTTDNDQYEQVSGTLSWSF